MSSQVRFRGPVTGEFPWRFVWLTMYFPKVTEVEKIVTPTRYDIDAFFLSWTGSLTFLDAYPVVNSPEIGERLSYAYSIVKQIQTLWFGAHLLIAWRYLVSSSMDRNANTKTPFPTCWFGTWWRDIDIDGILLVNKTCNYEAPFRWWFPKMHYPGLGKAINRITLEFTI